jgi:RHS repeat-associated protein
LTLGRVIQKKLGYYRTFAGQLKYLTFQADWTYNNEGQLTSTGYPIHREGSIIGRRTVNYGYDSLARMNSVQTLLPTQGDLNPSLQNVIGSVQFNAFGGITSMSHLGVTESRTYNVLGQMTRMTKGSLIDVEYRFSATQNDGKILSQKNWLTGEDVTYQYDELERLIAASTTNSTSWGLSWSYDGFGNRLAQSVTQGTGPVNSVLVDGNTNRISSSGYTYDANGNMTQMPKGSGSMTLEYDHSNRMTKATHPDGAEDYRYAPDNRRIWRNQGKTVCNSVDNSNTVSFAPFEVNAEQVIFYGLDGRKMGVYCVTSSPDGGFQVITASEENVYYGGRLVGKRTGVHTAFSNGQVGDFTMDRLHSKGDGSKFYPYGESRTSAAGDDREQFATYTRDQGTGLDYADQRWYASGLGRFGSVDPSDSGRMQSVMKSHSYYVFVGNQPTDFIDPNGTCYFRDGSYWDDDGIPCDLGPGGIGGGTSITVAACAYGMFVNHLGHCDIPIPNNGGFAWALAEQFHKPLLTYCDALSVLGWELNVFSVLVGGITSNSSVGLAVGTFSLATCTMFSNPFSVSAGAVFPTEAIL